MYVLIGILLLGILIAVHEFGHFMAARLTGIEVMEFAIGMGPRICGWQSKKSGTKFSLRCIPLGGFCAFYGEDDVEGKSKDDPRAYSKQAVWKRIITVAMGPLMNFVLALVVAVGFYWVSGGAVLEPVIDTLEVGRPAEAAGLLPGDRIVGVDGVDMADAPVEEIRAAIMADDQPRELTILRGTETLTLTLTPFLDENGQYRIGITFATASVPLPFFTAVRAGASYCLRAGTLIIDTLGQLFTNKEVLDQTSGPVGAVAVISQEVKQYGFDAFISLLVVISINLGIMNLLPIPGLDGSRIIFHVIEAIRRKPIAPEKEALVHLIGMVFLIGMMIFFTFKDVMRLVG